MIDTLVKVAIGIGGALGALLLALLYLAFFPEKAEKAAGLIFGLVARAVRRVDKTAVKLRVQSEVNSLRSQLHTSGPELIDKTLKISWTSAEEAEAVVRGGDVVVFMRDSRRHEENVANAVMAFLPKALLSRARRYVEPDTMRAVDLTVAKTLLSHQEAEEGALEVFYERHLDPARAASARLKQKVAEIDAIDLHGWLSRILLAEYRRVGEMLHPADPDNAVLGEAEEFADWLYKLAVREKDELGSLEFRGRYFRIAMIFVGLPATLAEKGSVPYRSRAKRHLYRDKFDAVYLLARDPHLWAVDEIVESLQSDAMVASHSSHRYKLRRDFQARFRLRREDGICACVRRKLGGDADDLPSEEDASTAIPVEVFSTAHAAPADALASERSATAESPAEA